MSLSLYMDVHVPMPITMGIRQKGVDVLTAQEDGTTRLEDPELLQRATNLGRVLFTFDSDLLQEAGRRQMEGVEFAGLIVLLARGTSLTDCLSDLLLVSEVYEPEDIANCVEFLPL